MDRVDLRAYYFLLSMIMHLTSQVTVNKSHILKNKANNKLKGTLKGFRKKSVFFQSDICHKMLIDQRCTALFSVRYSFSLAAVVLTYRLVLLVNFFYGSFPGHMLFNGEREGG